MRIANYDELIKKLRSLIDSGLTFKNVTDKEVLQILKDKKILEDILVVFSQEVYSSTSQQFEEEKKKTLEKYSKIELLKNYGSIDKLIGYMYYEYRINKDEFMKVIKLIIGENNEKLYDELINNNIIKEEENIVSLTDLGIQIAVSYKYSIDDLSRDLFVEKVKQRIK